VRCNIAFHLGSTDPWTPASTPLHFAAAGRGRVVAALLQAAAEAEAAAAAEGRRLPDPRLMQDWRGGRWGVPSRDGLGPGGFSSAMAEAEQKLRMQRFLTSLRMATAALGKLCSLPCFPPCRPEAV
jgi:hypothetical protein